MLKQFIHNKSTNTNPTYGTIEDIQSNEIPRLNIFPYPFYFVSNPLSEYPTVNDRRAGWSPEIVIPSQLYKKVNDDERDDYDYPKHCFQSACNTTFTYTKNECKKEKHGCKCNRCRYSDYSDCRKTDNCSTCKEDSCITLFR